jgi:hypothetical protein
MKKSEMLKFIEPILENFGGYHEYAQKDPAGEECAKVPSRTFVRAYRHCFQ